MAPMIAECCAYERRARVQPSTESDAKKVSTEEYKGVESAAKQQAELYYEKARARLLRRNDRITSLPGEK